MGIQELNKVAKNLMDVRSMIAALEAEAEALTDQIKAAMTERGEEVIQGDGWKATWKNVNSSRFDGITDQRYSVSKRLGHSSVSITTDIYAHAFQEADERNADILADVFLKKA